MAEVGLLAFARAALDVARAVLPPYRTRFSKHQFTQPQLLAILCLMRYEDWTFREAEVRLREHQELRQTLGLKSVPDFTTLYRFLKRLDAPTLDRAVGETVRRMPGGRGHDRRGARVAIDATGLAQGAVSTYFVRRLHHRGQKALPWRHWLKWLVVADLDQQILLSQSARRGPWNDCGTLPALVEAASHQARLGVVLADAECDSERNHTYIRKQLRARSVIPAKRGKKTWRVRGVRAEMRRAFPHRLYRRRALVETLFSSVKRKLSARAPGRSLRMQVRQALLLGLSFNLYRLKHRYFFPKDVNRAIYPQIVDLLPRTTDKPGIRQGISMLNKSLVSPSGMVETPRLAGEEQGRVMWSRETVSTGRAHEARFEGALGGDSEIWEEGPDGPGGASCARPDSADRDGA
jgi:hypothetical protein